MTRFDAAYANDGRQVRLAAAEALWMSTTTGHDGLWQRDWTLPVQGHRSFVQGLIERGDESWR